MRKLVIFAIAGLAASAAFIGAAAAIGGKALEALDFNFDSDKPDCQAIAGATATSRDLDWDGSDHVLLAVPAHSQYSPSNGPKLHVTGDPQFLAHLRVRDGAIEVDCHVTREQRAKYHDAMLQVTLPGKPFRRFAIAGTGEMTLQQLDQPMVSVNIAGSGDIKADGKVEHAEISIAGTGNVDMSKLASQIAMVHIMGSGNADIAPTEEADINVAGSGDVNLHTNPKRLETHIAGSGRIHNLVGG
jgi:hypothetical protein